MLFRSSVCSRSGSLAPLGPPPRVVLLPVFPVLGHQQLRVRPLCRGGSPSSPAPCPSGRPRGPRSRRAARTCCTSTRCTATGTCGASWRATRAACAGSSRCTTPRRAPRAPTQRPGDARGRRRGRRPRPRRARGGGGRGPDVATASWGGGGSSAGGAHVPPRPPSRCTKSEAQTPRSGTATSRRGPTSRHGTTCLGPSRPSHSTRCPRCSSGTWWRDHSSLIY